LVGATRVNKSSEAFTDIELVVFRIAIQAAEAALLFPARSNACGLKERFAAIGTDYPVPAIQQIGFFIDGYFSP
jgi:hypothetical protein